MNQSLLAENWPITSFLCNNLHIFICLCVGVANQPENCINICSTLCNMSRNSVGLLAIYSGGVIPLLVKLLG